MKIEFVAKAGDADAVALLVFEESRLSSAARDADVVLGGSISRGARQGRFSGKAGQTLLLGGTSESSQTWLIGAGAESAFRDLAIETAAAHAYNAAKMSGARTLAIELTQLPADGAARAAFAVRLAAYRFDKYRTTQKPEKVPSVETVRIVCADPKATKAAAKSWDALADGIMFTRDLVSEPANILHPQSFAERCKALKTLGLEVEVLGEKEMEKLGMGSLLGVGQGSVRESQLLIMRWNGGAKTEAPIAFIGKGVCFDTGGISIKPAEGMEEMKWDMGGGGAVAGLMHALAGRKAKVNAVGVIGLVENMPDGNAQRPGDVVKSMSGQTIEVINTDAEGRLVLADALWYTQDRFKPKFMIDLATLTGAMIVSLGMEYAGVFSNDDKLADNILAAGPVTGENVWRLPLPEAYERHIDSPIADVKNMGNGRSGGSITAALFLQRFVNKVPWAHIDIAPTAWTKDSKVETVPNGATGYGVRLLNQMVQDRYEG
ncbi:MAG: leucyl aminopeptidase [Caulobacterales bacterium]|nr:leucyl aminopeptidase [Caulobacterales bacterium]